MIEARFDDLGPTPRSFRLAEPVGVIEARRADEVANALAAAEGASERGLWAAGFVAYEAASGLDPSLAVLARAHDDPFVDLPLVWFALFEQREDAALPEPVDDVQPPPLDETWLPSVTRERYDRSVERIREHIAAGDTYQVNYTLRLRARLEGDERGLYRDLCLAQRGSFGAYLNLGRYRVLSASPELFLRIDRDRILTRPMKGTAPRGRWAEEDLEHAQALGASAKDRAENAMIVDLLRNDLGRVARPGTVEVPDMFTTERYETVWQMTSSVVAELRPTTGLVEVFRALFPSGSVTGAPKVRTMQLIRELEAVSRGVYCGAVGYLAPPGSGEPRANFNVAIRTVMFDAETGHAEYGVGGGITHDSRAAAEFDEVLAKARVLAVRRPPFVLIETLRYDRDRGVADLPLHLRRLSSSADYFGFTYDERRVGDALDEAVADAMAPVRVRVTLARDGSVDAVALPLAEPSSPIRLAIDDVPVDPRDALLFHKTSRRARYDDAAARHPEADDVLLVNDRGEATESTIANIAVRLQGRWFTPPLPSGCLPGTRRAALLEDGTLTERVIPVADLRRADGIALINSTRGWREAVLVDRGAAG
ncbi:MAG: aminodeoxychorismate synthase component I [Actinomycetota bacterium]